MPSKLVFPETEIVNRWVTNIFDNTRKIASDFGCSAPTISAILRRHLSSEIIDEIKHTKISVSSKNRNDAGTQKRNEQIIYARSKITEAGKYKSKAALVVATVNSVNKRKGKQLSQYHRKKLSFSHIGIHAGDRHPNWNGGTSKICWRGAGWAQARREARIRDGNTCQSCGKTSVSQGRSMDVHHRVSYFKFISAEQANDLENLVCLCRSCHRKIENGTIKCP